MVADAQLMWNSNAIARRQEQAAAGLLQVQEFRTAENIKNSFSQDIENKSSSTVGGHMSTKAPLNTVKSFTNGHWGPLWSQRKTGLLFPVIFKVLILLKAFQL